jgi:hypothetical protein
MWQFQVDPEGMLSVESITPDREIVVPMPWQAVFADLIKYSGYAWYRRSFDLDREWLGGEVLLHFGAVDYWCQVFVNGLLAGEHEGGYTAFTLPIGHLVREGENEVAVRVYDVAQSEICIERWPHFDGELGEGGPPFGANDIPHGKQEWYLNAGGIWQDVTLTATASTYIEAAHITPDIHTGTAHVKVRLAGNGEGSSVTAIRVAVSDGDGSVEEHVRVNATDTEYEVAVHVENVRLWSCEDPYLYRAEVRLEDGESQEVDSVSQRFGFREIMIEGGRFLLNGEAIFLRCALDQDMYPDTIYTVPSEEFLRDQFEKALELGLNSLRCHIKPPDPVYLDLADEMGILVWAEIPSWRTFYVKGTLHPEQLDLGKRIEERVEQTLVEMIERDFNHPSLMIWTIVNEDWGTTLPLSASDRAWVKKMYRRCKELDPTRLVVDNSACPHPWGPNIHVESDIDDFHVYANIPEGAYVFEQTVERLNLRPLWTYSTFGDAVRTGEEPLVLSEFGNWGLPSLEMLRKPNGGADPPWFDIGPWWNSWEGEAGWPAGVQQRFERLGLDKIWGSYEEFAAATQWHQYNALKFEIESMRRQPKLMGYVVTELSDIYWESNGLLDFYRNPKVYHDAFAAINGADMVVAQPGSYTYWQDESVGMRVYASHYSHKEWEGIRLRWFSSSETGETEIASMKRGEAGPLGSLAWRPPEVSETGTVSVNLQILAKDGEELARNRVDMLVLPPSVRTATYKEPVAVLMRQMQARTGTINYFDRPPEGLDWTHSDQVPGTLSLERPENASPGTLWRSMTDLGYNVATKITDDTKIAVTNYPSERILRWVREGGSLLSMSEGVSPFFWVQGRGGTYGGSWLTSYSWLRPDVHRRLRVRNPLGLPYMQVIPRRTILGLPVEDKEYHGDFLAGQVSGWVGHPAVHTVQFRYGKGKVIMTTFNIGESLGYDPVAAAMLHDLVDYLGSDACEPKLKSNY